jgi:hypothetical protein
MSASSHDFRAMRLRDVVAEVVMLTHAVVLARTLL